MAFCTQCGGELIDGARFCAECGSATVHVQAQPPVAAVTLEGKCHTLGEVWMFFKDTADPTWTEFFEWADVGLPLAYLAWQGLANPTDEGLTYIDNTWTTFCEMIDIDPDVDYRGSAAAFAASSHPPLADG